MHRTVRLPLVLFLFFCSSGANCTQKTWPKFPGFPDRAPRLLAGSPSKQQIIDVVNAHSARIESYSTNNATLTIGGTRLNTNIAIQQPKRFRIRSRHVLSGPELDLGSNDELFWMWIKSNQPRALYYCHHHQLAAARQFIPIQPRWLIDSLGLTTFAANVEHTGPYLRKDGKLEIHSQLPAPDGNQLKITVLDERARVLEQHWVTANRSLLASCFASGHEYNKDSQASLPTRLKIQLPPAGISFTIDLGDPTINHVSGDPNQLWSKPNYLGFEDVDVATLPGPSPQIPQVIRLPRPVPKTAPTRIDQRRRGLWGRSPY